MRRQNRNLCLSHGAYTTSNSAPEHATDIIQEQQIEHKNLKFTHPRIVNFTFIVELQAKLSLSKYKSYN